MGVNQSRNLRVMVIQAETTPGTMETDVATGDFLQRIRNIEISPGFEFDDEGSKYANGSHAEDEAIIGRQPVTITCNAKMTYIDATTEPNWWALCKMCGLGAIGWDTGSEVAVGAAADGIALVNREAYDDVTYTVWIIDREIGSSPVYTIYKVRGCMGNAVFSVDGVGRPWLVNFTISGVCEDIVDGSNIVINSGVQAQLAQAFLSSTVSLGGTAVQVARCQLDLGNTISPLDDQSKAEGIHYFHRTNTQPRISIDPLAVKQATTDWHSIITANTSHAVSMGLGSNMTIKGIDAQPINPGLAEREGLVNWDLTYRCLQNGTPGTQIDAALDLEDTIEILLGART